MLLQELIGNKILPMCRGDSFKFHAAGREDIDVSLLPLRKSEPNSCSYEAPNLPLGTHVGFRSAVSY